MLVDLANCLSEVYDITIFTIYAKGELEKELLSKVKIKSLYAVSYQEFSKFQQHIGIPLKVLLQKNKIYQEKIQDNYDVEIAFLEGPVTRLLSRSNLNTKKIAWVHNDIAFVFGKGIKAKIKKKMDEKIYSKYQELVFVSKDNLCSFEKKYPYINNKKQVIYNYIDAKKIIEKSREKQKENFNKNVTNFVTVARLVKQKGIDRLIKVHKKLIDEGLIHNFYVIGDGPEKENLEILIKENNLENTFKLLGKKENPYPYMKNADYFCLFSKFEGYGMVIEEAKILKKTILITNTAAKEAVQDYMDYEIAENSEEGIFELLKHVLTSKKVKRIIQNEYHNEEIIEKIKKLIEGKE